jgi:hypothetical protein
MSTETRERDLQEIGKAAYESIVEMVTALDSEDVESREGALQNILEDPLSIEVRSGWTVLGQGLVAEEFNILLATGGPAVRIVGELDQYKEPARAWLEVQDWFTPWTEYTGGYDGGRYMETLLTYARCFYFGE